MAGLAEVHRLLTAYGLGEAILLDLAELRGFDYYSGVNFEGYVEGFGAELVGGGRYDQMLARFGTPVPGDRVRVRREPRSCSPSRPRASSLRRPGPSSSSSISRRTRGPRWRSAAASASWASPRPGTS